MKRGLFPSSISSTADMATTTTTISAMTTPTAVATTVLVTIDVWPIVAPF